MDFFSIIITVSDDNLPLLPATLENVLSQGSSSFEIIIIDARRQVNEELLYLREIPQISRVYAAWDLRRFALLNKGASLAKGVYLHFLSPGEFYLSRNGLLAVKEAIEKEKEPDLFQTGYIIRHSMAAAQNIFIPITSEALYRGQIPMSLRPLWIKRSYFLSLKGFDESLLFHGGLDFICRSVLQAKIPIAYLPRVITDYEYRRTPPKEVIQQYMEALGVFLWNFGPRPSLLIWIRQNSWRFIRWWGRRIRAAFVGYNW